MKFSRKLLLWTTIIIALTLGLSGYYFVNYVFRTSLNREIGQALDENSILRFAFETAALNVPVKYDLLQDSSVEQIASNLETGGQGTGRLLRLSDEGKTVLYASDGFETDDELLKTVQENQYSYRVIRLGDKYYIQTGSSVNALGRALHLETLRDVSQVFAERDMGFTVFRRLTVLMLLLDIGIMYFIASRLTQPIKLLMQATKEMASGDYGYRARQVSNDELGQLTQDFNHMSEALEQTIGQLEGEVQAREDFVGAFAHELKTPLTSIIGYADMLRSRKLDEEKSLLSANYIYTEGKRLETMSLRLLDIIVTKKEGIKPQKVQSEVFFEYLRSMFLPKEGMEFEFAYDQGVVWADVSLIQTVLVNLVDNACKASEAGGKIEVSGCAVQGGYRFTVRDFGIGIPAEELSKITQAFYMVDKSRSRSRNGAGLGLALCTEILAKHGSKLDIESTSGEGTVAGFILQEFENGAVRGEDFLNMQNAEKGVRHEEIDS